MFALIRNPYLVLGLVALIWAGNAIAGKLAAGHVSPMLLTALRWLVAVVVILPFAAPDVRREWPLLRRHLLQLFCLSAVGFAGFNALFYLALNYTSAINVTITQSAMPLLVFLGNLLLFRVGFSLAQLLGFSLTLLGVLVTVSHGQWQTLMGLQLNRGDALMLLAVTLYAGYTLALRYKPALHWRTTILTLAVSALLTSIPFALLEYANGDTVLPHWRGLAVVVYVGIFPSLFAQSLYIRGVEMIGANRANLFINLVPVFGAVLAVTILGEALHAYHVVALLMVLGGIYLAERGARAKA